MSKRPCYVKKMSGFFPGAGNVDAFWKNLLKADVAGTERLDTYWNENPKAYGDADSVGYIYMDRGCVCEYSRKNDDYPRQIQAGIDVVLDLLGSGKNKINPATTSLIIASEWTDHSYYEEALGNIPKGDGYSVEKQIRAISEKCGIKGVTLAVDTACASSLYALELAEGILESGLSKSVIVLGLNMYLHSFLYRGFSKLGALSKRGRLTSFDSEADGIVPGEAACGILLDQSPDQALAQIDGIGLSTDGNEGSAFSPGFNGQMEAYKRAFREGTLEPDQIDYLEAHGTATILGDQTEISSIQKYYKRGKDDELIVGASKSNIGHTLAASGLASIIKACFIIKEKMLPPHIKTNRNPLLNGKGIRILERRKKLNKNKVAVGVSSFGFGGSNAHIILKTPDTENHFEDNNPQKKFYIRTLEVDDQPEMDFPGPVLKGVPMGPRMQERIDPFQRCALKSVQTVLNKAMLTDEERENLSCVFLNNLGGKLSLDFEKKYRLGEEGPELSIEAVASTLPSMLSGYPSLLFNFRGHHMLISGTAGALGDLLCLCPYLLEKAEGDIILGVARKNFSKEKSKEGLAVFLISRDLHGTKPWLASIELNSIMANVVENVDMGEASGLDELIRTIQKGQGEYSLPVGKYQFGICVNEIGQSDEKLKEELISESELNKKIALDYLALVSHFRPEPELRNQNKYGSFLANCEKVGPRARAELVVDEGHSYFFDHPLDHVPGILMIHACEELLEWYIDEPFLPTGMNIRFTRFLEKDGVTTLTLHEVEKGKFEFDILQNDRSVGILKVSVVLGNPGIIQAEVSSRILSVEDKKYTHKHRSENILVSALSDDDRFFSQARDLNDAGNGFFHHLLRKRQSMLYFGEITRQFVMLMAHLEKKIPLEKKMNLISIDLEVSKWTLPPFDLKLEKFDILDSEKFMLADVKVNFINRERIFGSGSLKAQVVTKEYYQKQRGD